MSLMKSTNNSGPSTDPCGTPLSTVLQLECLSPIPTFCLLPDNQLFFHLFLFCTSSTPLLTPPIPPPSFPLTLSPSLPPLDTLPRLPLSLLPTSIKNLFSKPMWGFNPRNPLGYATDRASQLERAGWFATFLNYYIMIIIIIVIIITTLLLDYSGASVARPSI